MKISSLSRTLGVKLRPLWLLLVGLMLSQAPLPRAEVDEYNWDDQSLLVVEVCYTTVYDNGWDWQTFSGTEGIYVLEFGQSLWIPDEYYEGYDEGWGWWSESTTYYTCSSYTIPVEQTWEYFEDLVDYGSTEWVPDCGDFWEDGIYLQGRHNWQWYRVGERSNLGNERNVDWEYRYEVEGKETQGCKPLNAREFEDMVGEWGEVSGGPSCDTVWEDLGYWFIYTEQRERRVGMMNDRDGIYESQMVVDTRYGMRWEQGCKPLNWQPFEEEVSGWQEVSRTPATSTVWEDMVFSQIATDERIVRTGERNDRGEERNVDNSVTQTRQRTIENVPGTKPLNWHFWETRPIGTWYDWTSWSPAPSGYWFWEDVLQSITRRRNWEDWRINDRGDSQLILAYFTSAIFNQTVKGTKVPAIGALQFDLGAAGLVQVGVGATAGTVTLPGGISVIGNGAGAGRVTIPASVIPGGVTVNTSGGTTSVVRSSGTTVLNPGASLDLGGGVTVNVSPGGQATVTVPGGISIAAGPAGGSLSFPNGVAIRVSVTGRVDLDLPPGTPSVVTKAVQIGGAILNGGAGHAISVRDAIGLIVGPLPPNPLLDLIDIGVAAGGIVQLGLRQGNDGTTQWVPIHVNRLELNVVSRDKFLAGSIAIPQGMNNVELEFVNTTTGETLGRYGSLLGGGATKIYNTVPEILSDADIQSRNGDVESYANQNVWFVKDGTFARSVSFYTSFSAVGDVEVRAYQGSERIRVAPHRLVASADFGEWITYVENWVNGVGFDFPGAPAPSSSFTFGYAAQTGVGASANAKRNLVRGSLIPLFNVVSQVKGLDALAKGLLEGFVAGAKDDWETVKLIGSGVVIVAGWQQQQVQYIQNLIISLRDHPLTRARDFMAVVTTTVEQAVFKSFELVDAGLSTWEGFRRRSWPTWEQIKNGATKAWTVANNLVGYVASGIRSWTDDFASRMIASADELTAYQNTAWYAGTVDPMEEEMRALQNVMNYSAGYALGYLSEQVMVGAVTGGTLKIAQVLIRGGTSAAAVQLIKRGAIAVTTRLTVLKKTVQGAMASIQLRIAVETALLQASKTPVSAAIKTPQLEFIETAFSAVGFRAQFTVKALMENLVMMPRHRRLVEEFQSGTLFFKRTAEVVAQLDTQLTGTALRNWQKAFELSLPLKSGELDRASDLLQLLQAHTPEGRLLTKEVLESINSKSISDILAEGGIKSPLRIASVYPEIFHYADVTTILKHSNEIPGTPGVFFLTDHPLGRYISPANVPHGPTAKTDIRALLQLPSLASDGPARAFSRGAFKCRIQTADIADDIIIPVSRRHGDGSNFIPQEYLEYFTKDNLERGPGLGPQFTQKRGVIVEIINQETGLPMQNHQAFLDWLVAHGLTPDP